MAHSSSIRSYWTCWKMWMYGTRGKELLHLGVGLGKADWVQELLARGAHTEITDDSQRNAFSLAEAMVRQFPDDVDRAKVLNLVSLVHRRDQVILCHLEASSSRSTDHVTPVAIPECDIASLKSSVDSLRREMKSLARHLTPSLEELKAEFVNLTQGCVAWKRP
ncbi:uncharacterized protein LOC124170250 [Ischnura elegans]|uniref:uncharacterized protein LOC124170250 n=1 Tax=Ischnura elegans TaxID=197161 RepID=UPI001ED86F6E|nr:uncharacterized protein LOC124170250 [Ischnura elegans]